MKWWTWGFTIAAVAGSAALLPGRGDAQVSVRVDLSWEWGDGGWRGYEPVRRYGPERVVVYERAGRPFRVPRGHLPPPGYCRLWYPGVPPGRQPPPERCGVLFRAYAHRGAVIIGAPAYRDVYGAAGRYQRDRREDRFFRDGRGRYETYGPGDRYDRYDRGQRGKKKPRKRGRGRG